MIRKRKPTITEVSYHHHHHRRESINQSVNLTQYRYPSIKKKRSKTVIHVNIRSPKSISSLSTKKKINDTILLKKSWSPISDLNKISHLSQSSKVNLKDVIFAIRSALIKLNIQ